MNDYALRITKTCFAILTLITILAILHQSGILTLWEDGSWALGRTFPWWAHGCLPWGICN